MLKKKLLAFDYILFFMVICMVLIGLVVIASVNRLNNIEIGFNYEFINSEFFSQVVWAILGFFVLFIVAFVDYRFICKFYLVFYVLNIILLILLLLFGNEVRSVKRWIFGIQPSEFSKIFMIIFIASYIDKNKETINSLKTLFILLCAIMLPFWLINEQPSLSASLVLIAIAIFQIFMGGISFKYLKWVILVVAPIFICLLIDIVSGEYFFLGLVLEDYQISRISSIVSFDLTTKDSSLYQTRNSVWAIGSGQLTGKGLFNGSMNQLNYVPDSNNDFIFSIVGEEFGFVGCFIILAIMFLIMAKSLIIANSAIDDLGMLLVVGVVGMLFFQVFVNVGVATSLLPNTGMPFPFLSTGGSSIFINMASIGLILNVGMIKPKNLFEF